MDLYRNQIVPEACGGQDVLGGWWGIRIDHTVSTYFDHDPGFGVDEDIDTDCRD